MLTPDTEITVYADWVEFRNLCSFGVQVILVHLTYVPRVTTWVEYVSGGAKHRAPLTLTLVELIEFASVACERSGRDSGKCHKALEAFSLQPSDH